MHRAITAILPFEAPLAAALCIGLTSLLGNGAISAEVQSPRAEQDARTPASAVAASLPSRPAADTGSPSDPDHDPEDNIVVVRPNPASDLDSAWPADANDSAAVDRDYLIETAVPGSTMVRQGPQLAMGRLHPEFVRRLAAAIREARASGLPSAGIFSAYRPPAFGVGGFSDKFNSLHTYGLAVDMTGIGGPGSAEAKSWYESAARHGIVCPYGLGNRVEWNHCQPTRIKIILADDPLRATVTGAGPITLESMFDAGNSLLESATSAAEFLSAATTDGGSSEHLGTAGKGFNEHTAPAENRKLPWNPGLIKIDHLSKPERPRLLRSEQAAECTHPHRVRKDACEDLHETKTGKLTQKVHSRQASTTVARESHKL